MLNKCYRFGFLLFFMLSTSSVNAHVQWFVTPDEMKNVAVPMDMLIALISISVLMLSFIAVHISQRKVLPSRLDIIIRADVGMRKELINKVMTIFTIVFFLLLVSQGGFLAPNLILPVEYDGLGWFLQALVVVLLALNNIAGGAAILATTFLMLATIPFSVSVNYMFEFISIGMFFILSGIASQDFFGKGEGLWKKSIVILRVGVGLQLIVLAFTEKLIYPGLAVAFIEMFPFYNFFQTLGFLEFSDVHFAYFIGISELSLGITLTLGLANRVVMMMLACAFTTTAIIHGIHEIEGHLPFFGAAFVLLVECKNKTKQIIQLSNRNASLA